MSKKEAKRANNIARCVIITLAGALSICALFYNPYHLWTSGLVAAFGFEFDYFKESKDYDIR